MQQYILKGIVHPERAILSMGPFEPKKITHLGSNRELSISLNIVMNQITIWIETNEEWNVYDLRNVARHFASILCSILSFIKGYYYEIEIIQILSKELNIDIVFGIDIPCITSRSVAFEFNDMFSRLLAKTGGKDGIYYNHCFKDLSLALKDAEDTAFYCYRAIESLKKLCKNKFMLEKEGDQWEKVWEITDLNRSYIEKIKIHADEARHGDYIIADETDRVEFLMRTWDVVEKFVLNIDKHN